MENFKYQIGQVVKVRNDIGHTVFCKMENNEKGAYFIENMKAYGGKKVTISHYEGGRYKIKEDGDVYIWTDEMFEEKKEKSKNEVTHFDDFVARMQIKIERVIYNGTTTILFYKVPLVNNYGQTLSYSNEKKIVAKCRPEDKFDKATGLEVCTIKAFRKELEKMLKKF